MKLQTLKNAVRLGRRECFVQGASCVLEDYPSPRGSGLDGMYLRPLGMAIRQTSGRLTFEGAAELYWEMFVDGLRR